eukprot:CAMPEP_0116930882 /NCGR_PEP_ID=MMETSP0467-20121206/27470_1 /TAXON_ID=283647 /ORGANISM="Mesodinium pulex, Strain SPMC105" /LENGTH=34 /DNA_ID= /DNA_START= /DNA_END= /DNA_ORIENTATION=
MTEDSMDEFITTNVNENYGLRKFWDKFKGRNVSE